MLLVCSKCHKNLRVDHAGPPDSALRLTCSHGDRPLLLDRYAGKLLPAKARPASEDVAERPASDVHSRQAVFHPRVSTGRDTMAAVFIIVGIIAFQMGQPKRVLQDTDSACRLGFDKTCQILKLYGPETQS